MRIVTVTLWILVAAQFANLARHAWLLSDVPGETPGWDFKVYRAAATALAQGQSPFGPGALKAQGIEWPYNYPPILNLVLPLFAGEYDRVRSGYLVAELIAVALAAFVVIRGLDLKGWRAPAAAWLVVGGGFSALNLDFNAGNVTAIEMLPAAVFLAGVWRRNTALIIVGMTVLCFAKPTWVVLAVIPLVRDLDLGGLRRTLFAVAGALVVPVASLLVFPNETRIWFATGSKWREYFNVNPCLREVVESVFHRLGLPFATFVWLAIVLAFGVALMVMRRKASAKMGPAFIAALTMAAPIYFLRLKPYSIAVTALFCVFLFTYSGRSLRLFLPALLLVAFPFVVSYDYDSVKFSFEGGRVRDLLATWPAVLSVVASGWILWAIRRASTELGIEPHSSAP